MKKSTLVKYMVVCSIVMAGFLTGYKVIAAPKVETEEEKNTRGAIEVYALIENELKKEGTNTNA